MIKKRLFTIMARLGVFIGGLLIAMLSSFVHANISASPSLSNAHGFSGSGYTEDIEDMRIETAGGTIRIVRSFVDGGWQINRRWNPVEVLTRNPAYKGALSTKNCPDGEEVCFVMPERFKNIDTWIDRNGVRFFGSKVYSSSHEKFELDNSSLDENGSGTSKYKWIGKNGDWIEYHKEVIGKKSPSSAYPDNPFFEGLAFPVAFGRANDNAIVRFVYDDNSLLLKLVDGNGNDLLMFEYSETQPYDSQTYMCRGFKIKTCNTILHKITDYSGRSVEYSGSTVGFNGNFECRDSTYIDPKINKICSGLKVTSENGDESHYLANSVQILHSGGSGSSGESSSTSSGGTAVENTVHIREREILLMTVGGVQPRVTRNKYEWIDPMGRRTLISEESGHVLDKLRYESEVDDSGVGVVYEFEYDSGNNEFYIQEQYSSGRVVERWSDAKEGESIRTDINGNTILEQENRKSGTNRIRKKRDFSGLVTTDELDEKYNLLKRTYPDESTEEWTYTPFSNVLTYKDENDVLTENEYDDQGNLLRKTEAKGTAIERVTEYTWDEYGNKLSETQLGDGNTDTAVRSWTYDDYGNITSETDPEGHVTYFEDYDALGNYRRLIDAREKVWLFEYDQAGNLLSETTPLNHKTSYEYDAVDNLIKMTDAEGHSTTYEYDERDNLIKSTNAYSYSQYYSYDHDDRITQFVDEEGVTTTLDYDEPGRLTSITDGGGNITRLYYGEGENTGFYDIHKIEYPTFIQTLAYDERGRVREQVNILPEGDIQTTVYEYDNADNLVKVIDPKSRSTEIAYDALYRTTQVIDALSNSVKLDYDNRDNIKSVTNQNQAIIRAFSYDRRDNTTEERWPNGSTFSYDYDQESQLIERIDGKGQVTRLDYDDTGRLTQEQYFPDDSTASAGKTVDYTYNKVDSILSYNDGTTSGTFTYDHLQRKLTETINYGPFEKGHSYTYKKNDKKASFTGPDQQTISYSYNDNNQLSLIQLPGLGSINISSYEWQQPKEVRYPGGAVTEYSYNGLQMPLRIHAKDPAQNTQMDFKYQYDLVNSITQKATEHGVYNYIYDELDRLISSQSPIENNEWDYDGAGNRIRERFFDDNQLLEVETEWAYNGSNQLEGYGGYSYLYDENGNTIQKTDTTTSTVTDYHYNLSDRLTSVTKTDNDQKDTIASYYYDPFGRRLWKETQQGKQYFHYADEGLTAELNETGSVTQSYGFGSDSYWTTDPFYTRVNGEYYFYQNDHLGTPQWLSSSTGAKVWNAKYKAFGGASAELATVQQNLRFSGQYSDIETGLHQNYFRDYVPRLGRYVQRDPIDILGGPNVYTYAGINPVLNIDSHGLFVCGGVCVGAAVASVAIVNWTRNIWNEPVSDISDVNDWTELTPGESIYHRMGPGNESNRKFVSPDGRSEAVYDCSDNLVTDPANVGTYNFFGPRVLNGIPHVITDVVPYFVFGNSPSDMFNPQRFVTTYNYIMR